MTMLNTTGKSILISMSSFKFSPDAKVFTPMQEDLKIRRWREKIYPRMSESSIEHQRGLLTPKVRDETSERTCSGLLKLINELYDENTTLKQKNKTLREKSESEQKIIINLKKEVEEQKETINEHKLNYHSVIRCLEDDLEVIKEQNDGNAKNCLRIISEWQGRSVKLNWILKEMERVGAIKRDHEWALELRHSIEFPEDDGLNPGNSVYEDVPFTVIESNLPSFLDAHMEVVDEDIENQRIQEWSEEASLLEQEKRIYACIKIQKFWRKK
jgi:hypothetical protein